MAVITYEVVATAIGRPINDADERAQVTQWISDVEMLIEAKIDDWDLESLDDLNQPLLKYVVREVVIARMRYREDRNTQRADASEDDTDSGLEHYFLRVLDPWWALLAPAGEGVTGVFSARPYFEPDAAEVSAWA